MLLELVLPPVSWVEIEISKEASGHEETNAVVSVSPRSVSSFENLVGIEGAFVRIVAELGLVREEGEDPDAWRASTKVSECDAWHQTGEVRHRHPTSISPQDQPTNLLSLGDVWNSTTGANHERIIKIHERSPTLWFERWGEGNELLPHQSNRAISYTLAYQVSQLNLPVRFGELKQIVYVIP